MHIDAFSGFTAVVTTESNYYDAMRMNHEMVQLSKGLIERMGKRVRKHELHSGWDKRTGRDYFYSNFMIWTQRRDPSFVGIYHYREGGPRFQVWRYEHDDAPVIDTPLLDLYRDVEEASAEGLVGDLLDKIAEEIRLALSLR